MRILLALALVASLAACSKKKPATTPTNAAPAAESGSDGDDMKESSTPDGDEDAKPMDKSADPCEGGQ